MLTLWCPFSLPQSASAAKAKSPADSVRTKLTSRLAAIKELLASPKPVSELPISGWRFLLQKLLLTLLSLGVRASCVALLGFCGAAELSLQDLETYRRNLLADFGVHKRPHATTGTSASSRRRYVCACSRQLTRISAVLSCLLWMCVRTCARLYACVYVCVCACDLLSNSQR